MSKKATVSVIGREGWWELLRRPWHVRCSECRTVGRHQLLSAAQSQAEAHRTAHGLIVWAEVHTAMRGVLLRDANAEGDPS